MRVKIGDLLSDEHLITGGATMAGVIVAILSVSQTSCQARVSSRRFKRLEDVPYSG